MDISRRYYAQSLRAAVVAAAIIALGGCGGSDRPKTIPIAGRVLIDGQPPGEAGNLAFTPVTAAEGYNKRPASGAFTADGTYRVMSWSPDDGLVPGHYAITILPGDLNSTKIPVKYHQSGNSGLEVDVPVDQDQIAYDINIVTK
jgi:hypothetical protein